mgnify:CR=1 FL=1
MRSLGTVEALNTIYNVNCSASEIWSLILRDDLGPVTEAEEATKELS